MDYPSSSTSITCVLVVDDDESMRDALCELLETKPDLIAAKAASGAEAIRMVDLVHPNVILLDMSLHDMNGIQVTREILARQPSANIVLCSGFSAGYSVAEGLRAGALGYIRKDTLVDHWPALIHEASAGRFTMLNSL
jgi:DNA-binding NarL/FixJ family response regulator